VEENRGQITVLETKHPEVHGHYLGTGWQHCIQCAVMDENQSIETDLGYFLGQLSVIVGALLFSRGRQSTDTLIPCSLQLHSKFSQWLTSTTVHPVDVEWELIHETFLHGLSW